MTDTDLRLANMRLQSGGEVNPYTARHMGLFVVGRLAAQHSFVVRLRSTIAGDPNSGTTAGVYVPKELLSGADAPDQFGEPEDASPADTHAGIATALALDEDHGHNWADEHDEDYLNGHSEVPVALLPQRDPGASGISDIPASLAVPAAAQPDQTDDDWPEDEWPEDSMPAQTTPDYQAYEPVDDEEWGAPIPAPADRPTDTSGFFAARAHAAGNGVGAPAFEPQGPQERRPRQSRRPRNRHQPEAEPARHAVADTSGA